MPDDPNELSWNDRIIANFHENQGKVTVPPFQNSNLLLMTSTGATTGKPRTAPLGYTRDGERYVVVGSNSGGPKNPVWLRNIQADPDVTMEVDTETFPARATVTKGAERRRLLDAHQAAIPIFKKYEVMAGRELPVVALERIAEG